ncbi:unnamed protein product [Angiostrongylus costaricensis]|uniref:Rad60-SLD domain-containing protein n=1 Tax=Angiostrongylus costaricensis TaxID=334426 RepID=A0A0R3PFZ3_ANGCS|nr:unnamed protein product [Angiostrongylus costaricensis]
MLSNGRSDENIVLQLSGGEVMREFFTPIEQLKRVNRFFNLHSVYIYINHIYEEDGGCEIYLSDSDFETVQSRKGLPKSEKILRFRPRYCIRPSSDQIVARIELYWDMKLVEYNDRVPDGFTVHSEFFLPEGQFSEVIKEKEEENVALAAAAFSRPTVAMTTATAVEKRCSRRDG